MPITGVFWSGASNRDLHVLRGQSTRDLTVSDLAFTRADGTLAFASVYLAATPDVTLAFRPLFRRSAETATEISGHGIHVNKTTGVVRVDAAAAAPAKRNFIIEVTATNNVGGTAFTETIRVQVHGSVTRVWLTPDALSVRPSAAPRPETTNFRFTVRAEFDDGVVGDLTNGHGVAWTPASNVNGTGRLIIAAANNPGDSIVITATLPAALGGGSATATLRVLQPWASEPAPPRASIVPGGGWPGTVNPALVPNVLYLGDGFVAGDQAAFEGITNRMVTHLKSDRLARPFDLLATAMNFWRTFVPAQTRGISFRCEVFTFDRDGRTVARPVPVAEKPPAAGDWKLKHLLYAAGLPVPGDEAPARTAAVLRAEWAALLDPDPGARATDALIAGWKLVAKRTFIDEIDAFPAMSYGTPPAANATDYDLLSLHADRGGIADLQRFYAILADERGVVPAAGQPIGEVWRSNTFRFDSTDLVVLLSSFPGGRANNATGFIALSTLAGVVDIPVLPVAGRKAFTLNLTAVLQEVGRDRCRTMAHELAHSFALEDEYAEIDRPFPRTEASLDSSNVQTEADAKNAAGDLHGDEIKWIWHRVRNAGVVAGPITAEAGGRFAVPMDLDHGFRFVQGDTVLLRQRTWGARILKKQLVLAKNLRVAAPPTADRVVVEAAPGHAVALADFAPFGAGSLLFAPVPAPDSVRSATYPFAEMVAKNIKDHITATKRPLTAVPCVIDRNPIQTPILNGVDLPRCFKHKNRIVGLYAGGVLFGCGIFHPTGTCMMRNSHDDHAEFCAVCRYIVVDLINPTKHFEIDRDYADIYPLV